MSAREIVKKCPPYRGRSPQCGFIEEVKRLRTCRRIVERAFQQNIECFCQFYFKNLLFRDDFLDLRSCKKEVLMDPEMRDRLLRFSSSYITELDQTCWIMEISFSDKSPVMMSSELYRDPSIPRSICSFPQSSSFYLDGEEAMAICSSGAAAMSNFHNGVVKAIADCVAAEVARILSGGAPKIAGIDQNPSRLGSRDLLAMKSREEPLSIFVGTVVFIAKGPSHLLLDYVSCKDPSYTPRVKVTEGSEGK